MAGGLSPAEVEAVVEGADGVVLASRVALRAIATVAAAMAAAGMCAAAAGGAASNQRGGAAAAAVRLIMATTAALAAFGLFGWRVAGHETYPAAGAATGVGANMGVEAGVARLHVAALAGLAATFAVAGMAERAFSALNVLMVGTLVGGVLSPLAMRLEWAPGALFAPESGARSAALDIAGCGPLHIVSGAAALACAVFVGPRKDSQGRRRFDEKANAGAASLLKASAITGGTRDAAGKPFSGAFEGHDEALSGIGGLMAMWGLSLSACGAAPWAAAMPDFLGRTLLCTVLAAAAGSAAAAAGSVLVSKLKGYGGALPASTCVRGAIAGTAAVACGAPVLSSGGSVAVGAVAGLGFVASVYGLAYLRIDDALDIIASHLVGGLVGMLLGGVFAQPHLVSLTYGQEAADAMGGAGMRLLHALAVVVTVCAMSFLGTSSLFAWPSLKASLRRRRLRTMVDSPSNSICGSFSSGGFSSGSSERSDSNNKFEFLPGVDQSVLNSGPFDRGELLKFVQNLRSISVVQRRKAKEGERARASAERESADASVPDGSVARASSDASDRTPGDAALSYTNVDMDLLNGIEPLYDFLSAPLTMADELSHQLEHAYVVMRAQWKWLKHCLCGVVPEGKRRTSASRTRVRFLDERKDWNVEVKAATVTAKGEDRVLVLPSPDGGGNGEGAMSDSQWRAGELGNATLVCVFDGHAGFEAAELARERFPWALLSALSTRLRKRRGMSEALPKALSKAMAEIDALTKESQTRAGCTATAMVIRDGIITTANVGDSRGVIGLPEGGVEMPMSCGVLGINLFQRREHTFRLTVDHRLDDSPSEVRRLRLGGAMVSRLRERSSGVEVGPLRAWPGGLAVSRSLGDGKAHPAVNAKPYISRFDLNTLAPATTRMLVTVASDGLWDMLEDHEVMARQRRAKSCSRAARRLSYVATLRRREQHKPDDISVVCLKLEREPLVGDQLKAVKEQGGFVKHLSDAATVVATGDLGER